MEQTAIDVREILSQVMESPAGAMEENQTLAGLEGWDSLAVLKFMALVDARYGLTLSADEIAECETVGDLAALLRR